MTEKESKRNVMGFSQPSISGRTITGYAIVFNQRSAPLFEGGQYFTEIVLPSAITPEIIKKSDVKCLMEHNRERLLARSNMGKGSLKLEIDERGLKYTFKAPNTDDGNTAVELVKRGDIAGSSFGFIVESDEWKGSGGTSTRIIKKIKRLTDVTLTSDPAYPQTSVNVRSNQFNTNIMEHINLRAQVEQKVKKSIGTSQRSGLLNVNGKLSIDETQNVWYQSIIDGLTPALIIDKVGLKIQTGIKGLPIYPIMAGMDAYMEGEQIQSFDKDFDFKTLKAEKKGLYLSIPVSKTSLEQSGLRIYDEITNYLVRGASKILNRWIASPTPILKEDGSVLVKGPFVKEAPSVEFAGETPTHKEIVQMATLTLDADIDPQYQGMYVVSPQMEALLKTTPIGNGDMMIASNGYINGYPYAVTNEVPSGFVGFGFFEYCIVSEFAFMNVLIDAHTQARKNILHLIFQDDFDVTTLRPEAFTTGVTPTMKSQLFV